MSLSHNKPQSFLKIKTILLHYRVKMLSARYTCSYECHNICGIINWNEISNKRITQNIIIDAKMI